MNNSYSLGATGTLLKTFDSHTNTIVSLLNPPPVSDYLLSLSTDRTIKLWTISTGELEDTLLEDAAPTKMYYFPHTQKIILPKWNNSLYLISAVSLKSQTINATEFIGHNAWVLSAIELKNKTQFASCSRDKTIKIWEIEEALCLFSIELNNGYVNYLIEPVKDLLVSCSSDQTIKTYDVNTGLCKKSFVDGEFTVFQIEKIDENLLVSRSESNYINVWDFNKGKLVKTLRSHETNVICIKVLKSKKLCTGSYDHTIKVWTVTNAKEEATLTGHEFTVYCIEEVKKNVIISGSGDTTIKVWDLNKFQCLATLKGGHSKYVFTFLLLKDSKFVSGGYDGTVCEWKIDYY